MDAAITWFLYFLFWMALTLAGIVLIAAVLDVCLTAFLWATGFFKGKNDENKQSEDSEV